MDNRDIGFVLIFTAVLIGITTGVMKAKDDAYINMLIQRNNGSCFIQEENQSTVTCLHDPKTIIPFLGGGLLALTLAAFGIYLIAIKKQLKTETPEINKEKIISRIKDLDPNETLILNLIIEEKGTIFQSELVEKSKFTKVRVTRILDKLEGRGLIDRRRRGMTNIVILRQN